MIFLLYTTSIIDYSCETPFVAPFVAPHFTRKKRGHRYLGIPPAEPSVGPGKKWRNLVGPCFWPIFHPSSHIFSMKTAMWWILKNTQKRCENGNEPYLEILWNTSPYSTHTSITVLLDGLKPQKLLIGDDDIPGRKYLRPPAMLFYGVVPWYPSSTVDQELIWPHFEGAQLDAENWWVWGSKLRRIGFCLHPYH